jgi:hypothetical protein
MRFQSLLVPLIVKESIFFSLLSMHFAHWAVSREHQREFEPLEVRESIREFDAAQTPEHGNRRGNECQAPPTGSRIRRARYHLAPGEDHGQKLRLQVAYHAVRLSVAPTPVDAPFELGIPVVRFTASFEHHCPSILSQKLCLVSGNCIERGRQFVIRTNTQFQGRENT